MEFNEIITKLNPYYHNENVILFHGDCLDIMKLFPDNFVNLILTDPPYAIHTGIKTGFIANRYKKRGTWNNKDEITELNEWDKKCPKEEFDEIFRISKNQIIWGFQYYIEYFRNTKEIWIWDKKTGKSFFADCELAWTSFNGTNRKFEYQWCGCFKPDRTEKSLHPTMKPLELFKWCLRKCKKNQIILDCYAGSGTTAIACLEKNINLKCILIEREKKYCDIIIERIEHKIKKMNNEFYISEKENHLFKDLK